MSLFRSRLGLMVLIGAISMFVLAIGSAAAQANTYNVNPSVDPNRDLGSSQCDDFPADCSLTEAIDGSNTNSGDDVINVPAGTYDIDSELLIDREGGTLLIKGAGADTTKIDVHQEDRVLKIRNAEVTIQGVTITGGGEKWGGGGIANYSSAKTTLQEVAIVNNYAGFNLECGSSNQVCAFNGDGKGGGIYNSGDLTIEKSEISGNTALGDPICGAGYGGGIYNAGFLSMTNDTLNGNEAQNSGKECNDSGLGGGIFTEEYFDAPGTNGKEFASVVMLNVTLAGNEAGLGGGIASDYLDISQQTNGIPAQVASKNTIVADNTANDEIPSGVNVTSDADNCYLFKGQMQSAGNNLESDTSCDFVEPGDIQNGNAALGALGPNGGPTQTMALNTGSQALDTASNVDCPSTDQRGVTRPQNVICDIGAYEKELPAPPAQGGTAAATAAKPVAKSSISGPKSCTRSKATVKVSGQNISTVTYSLDGKKIKTAKGNKTSVTVNLKHKKSGVHRVTAKVSYTSATAASAQTKRFTVSRCARATAKPKFTG